MLTSVTRGLSGIYKIKGEMALYLIKLFKMDILVNNVEGVIDTNWNRTIK